MTQPNIPEKTLKEMTEFFLKTSIPRIIAERREKECQKKSSNSNKHTTTA